MITGLTVLVSIFTAYLFYQGSLLLGFVFMLLTVVMDMFDGAVARAANLATPFGATFDHTLDRYAEFFFMFGLMAGPAVQPAIPWWFLSSGATFVPWQWGFLALFGMIMASFSRAKAESIGGMDDCAVGIAERQEKLLLTFAGILLLALPATNIWMDLLSLFPSIIAEFFVSIAITNILTFCIALVAILSHFTVYQRLAYANKMIQRNTKQEHPAEF